MSAGKKQKAINFAIYMFFNGSFDEETDFDWFVTIAQEHALIYVAWRYNSSINSFSSETEGQIILEWEHFNELALSKFLNFG